MLFCERMNEAEIGNRRGMTGRVLSGSHGTTKKASRVRARLQAEADSISRAQQAPKINLDDKRAQKRVPSGGKGQQVEARGK